MRRFISYYRMSRGEAYNMSRLQALIGAIYMVAPFEISERVLNRFGVTKRQRWF